LSKLPPNNTNEIEMSDLANPLIAKDNGAGNLKWPNCES
jgi:hypothetical protein